jgi:hypothetical protein
MLNIQNIEPNQEQLFFLSISSSFEFGGFEQTICFDNGSFENVDSNKAKVENV